MLAVLLTFGMTVAVGTVDGTTPITARALGAVLLAERTDEFDREWACLDELWQHESGWDYQAANPASSARGIPQALVNLHELDEAWQRDPTEQIRWGLDYIFRRYGSPCSAWEAWTGRASLLPDGRWHGGWY